MNDENKSQPDAYRSLLLMSELERGEPVSQREIAGRLGIAVGLVNAYLKTLVRKGFVQVKAYPRNRYAYLLTPTGFAEKSRLAFQHVNLFHNIFRTIRNNSLQLFQRLRKQGVEEVAFCGVDEFTEIAYLSAQEARVGVKAVLDDERAGEDFFDCRILPLSEAVEKRGVPIVITSFRQAERLREHLLFLGVADEEIFALEAGSD